VKGIFLEKDFSSKEMLTILTRLSKAGNNPTHLENITAHLETLNELINDGIGSHVSVDSSCSIFLSKSSQA